MTTAAPQPSSKPAPTVGRHGVVYKARDTEHITEDDRPLSEGEAKRKQMAERHDAHNLLIEEGIHSSTHFVVDEDERLLLPPDNVKKLIGGNVTLAKVPPKIEFGMIPAQPTFFHEPDPDKVVGLWSSWSLTNHYPPNGRFYGALGDHIGYNAHLYITEFDPATRTVRCFPEINKVLGRTRSEFGDGKIHGWLDFHRGPELWFCTYWCEYPEPKTEDWATGYDGGHIMSLNVETGDITDYGVPVKRCSWPHHRLDTTRGIMYGVGYYHEFLAWDVAQQEVLWGGYLPEGMRWDTRVISVDEVTGRAFCSNHHPDDAESHILRYDPAENRCVRLDVHVPKNDITGHYNATRANTRHRGSDGLIYFQCHDGQMFALDPENETVTDKGINWPGEQRYTAGMEQSPGGRYIYYTPGAHGRAYMDGSPLIQYDTHTGVRKVLAFLCPFHLEKYGYTTGGSYGLKLDETGEHLFLIWNGAFTDHPPTEDVFGNAAIMYVHLPEAERQE